MCVREKGGEGGEKEGERDYYYKSISKIIANFTFDKEVTQLNSRKTNTVII